MLAEGDMVATQFTIRGTHKGELMGMAPSGKSVTLPIIVITKFEGGVAVEDWEVFDVLGLLQQIGAAPS